MTKKRINKLLHNEIGERYKNGETSVQLGEFYNVSPHTISRILKRIGIYPRKFFAIINNKKKM